MHKRHLLFWRLALIVFGFLLWLLSEVLLPFVAGLRRYMASPVYQGGASG
jgi:predicted PurR-regulated permease PerM